MTIATAAPALPLNEDFEDDFVFTKRAATTSDREAASGVPLTWRFTTRPAALDGTPAPAIGGLTPTGSELADAPGTYRVQCDQAQLQAVLRPYRWTTIYLCAAENGNVDCLVQPYFVTDYRLIA